MRIRILATAVCLLIVACGGGGESVTTSPAHSTPATSPVATETPIPSTSPPSPPTAATTVPSTTVPEATSTTQAVPPIPFSVTTPAEGARVSHRDCVFAGTAEPGTEVVAAGRYPVTVNDDGTWETMLILNPGGNMARFEATDTSGAVMEVSVPVYYDPPLVLRADGLGPVDFHTAMGPALASFVALLGPPDSDGIVSRETLPPELNTDPAPIHIATGYAGYEYARFVTWEPAGLMVMFSDLDEGGEQAAPNFNGWVSSDSGRFGARLTTAAGIGVGDLIQELQVAYGVALAWYDEPDELTGGWHFNVDSRIPWSHGTRLLRGTFDGDPQAATTRVSGIEAGFGFDTC